MFTPKTLKTLFAIFIFMVLISAPATIQLTENHELSFSGSVASAFGGGPGGGGGGGGNGGGGGGCDCGGEGGGPNGGGNPPPPPPPPPVCNFLKANGQTGTLTLGPLGGDVNLSWASSYATGAVLTPTGSSVAVNGSQSVNVTDDITYILRVVNSDGSDSCSVSIDVEDPVVEPPSCDAFTGTPTTLPYGGGNVDLAWQTSNVDSVSIDNGVGVVAEDGTQSVSVTDTITYTLTASKAGFDSAYCPVTITVLPENHVLTCQDVVFTASDTLVSAGSIVNLAWVFTGNVTAASIDNGIGDVIGSSSVDVTVNNDITYTMTIEDATTQALCPITIKIESDQVITCEENVTFSASDTVLPRGGGATTLTWTSTGLDSLSITDVVSTALSGSETVNVTADKTFVLTGVAGSETISCPIPVAVAVGGGGGGGGGSSLRCDLDISDEKISLGEEIVLTWNTTRAREVKITDNHGNVLLDTEDDDEFDGEMTIKPTKDTEYTLLSKSGTRERKCKVEVDLENKVTVIETRTHDPRVAGISLTQVPYTGFEAGPALTMIFYFILTIWGLFVAYVFVIRKDSLAGVSLAGAHDHVPFTDMSEDADPVTQEPIVETYVDSVVASTDNAPANLPTAVSAPVIGYAATLDESEVDESIEMTELENRAHAQSVLLSSDAMRFFMNATKEGESRNEKLDAAILQAKASFPSEGGWVALNLSRIETLITDVDAEAEVATQTESVTAGSLAEAIVEGNVVAAYQMISNRPMVALADAAADLDLVFRLRKGEQVSVSDMLIKNTESLTVEQIVAAITALTGAVDGTYTDEADAVKMAIMKAVKAVS